jgi:uncharacterized Zn-binding protein involved in type VI secretion
MSKRYIVLGDRTTHGGTVVTAQSNKTIDGIPVALIGDEVTCPKCSGRHRIVQGAENSAFGGIPYAREGDKVSCGASLVSKGQSRSTTSG